MYQTPTCCTSRHVSFPASTLLSTMRTGDVLLLPAQRVTESIGWRGWLVGALASLPAALALYQHTTVVDALNGEMASAAVVVRVVDDHTGANEPFVMVVRDGATEASERYALLIASDYVRDSASFCLRPLYLEYNHAVVESFHRRRALRQNLIGALLGLRRGTNPPVATTSDLALYALRCAGVLPRSMSLSTDSDPSAIVCRGTLLTCNPYVYGDDLWARRTMETPDAHHTSP